ncbi:unnamed protein product [Lepeophtheirus salmonis]|uniref:(salmon louse) hypothetical protein n=1 Tax=Lepeophtheirus salmonis TaxID=72036 RepID=A0A7R8CC32_LEPSM|nr:unnamed protein product [Lepeophtheirus salmonis]CAF2759381.1 unnamed protein product [Lepeophtheirus salmonis]
MKETPNYIHLVKRLWSCVTVQCVLPPSRKRDDWRKAITREGHSQQKCCKTVICELNEWEKLPEKSGLSRETFCTAKHCFFYSQESSRISLKEGEYRLHSSR